MNEYQSRNLLLKELGFNSYSQYLKSDLWFGIRRRVFKIKGGFCHCCPKPAVQVHHQKYDRETLLGITLKFLFPICAKCHKRIEFTGKRRLGRKRAFVSSTYQMRKRRRIFKKNKKIDQERIRKGLTPVYYP